MSTSLIFSIANMMVLPMWLLMLIVPKWKFTELLMKYKIIPVMLSVLYGVFIISNIADSGMPDFGSLDSVMQLFTDEKAVLAGWIHYLAFDLLIGMWLIYKNKEVKLHQLTMVPCLIGTFMFGPLGFLLYYIIVLVKKGSHAVH